MRTGSVPEADKTEHVKPITFQRERSTDGLSLFETVDSNGRGRDG